MATLEERLKRIRQSAALPSTSHTLPLPSSEDEAHVLLQQTAEEVELERGQGAEDEDDLEAWLAHDSDEGQDGSPVIGAEAKRSVKDESRALTKDAEEALQGLYREGTMAKAASLLQVEAKSPPVLSRHPSDRITGEHAPAESLEDDLADAMQGQLGQDGDDEDKTPSDSGEVSKLTARLAQLRSGALHEADGREHGKKAASEKDHSETTFDLPSPPTTHPTVSSDGQGGGNWKEAHGVQGRDLSSFEALVRLNATALGAPAKRSGRPSEAREGPDETQDWCCICNDDAGLSCLGCDDDLYCQSCWQQGHGEMQRDELEEHPTRVHVKRRKPVTAA